MVIEGLKFSCYCKLKKIYMLSENFISTELLLVSLLYHFALTSIGFYNSSNSSNSSDLHGFNQFFGELSMSYLGFYS